MTYSFDHILASRQTTIPLIFNCFFFGYDWCLTSLLSLIFVATFLAFGNKIKSQANERACVYVYVDLGGTLQDKISADLRLEISFDADGFFIWRETNGSAARAIQVWRRNEKFTIDDAWLLRLICICGVSVSSRSQHRGNLISRESRELLLWFSLFAAAGVRAEYIYESAEMQFQSAHVYIRVLCDRQIFIQKSCYITQFAGIHVLLAAWLAGGWMDVRESKSTRERSGESQSNWGKI